MEDPLKEPRSYLAPKSLVTFQQISHFAVKMGVEIFKKGQSFFLDKQSCPEKIRHFLYLDWRLKTFFLFCPVGGI